MKVLKGLLLPLTLLAISLPARAKDIRTQTATNQKTPIAVEVGVGHTIDFSQTEEQIFRVWVGDGGRCLQPLPSSPLEAGASILYLRRITPCQQVNGLPEVSETTLTLVTLSSAGETNIYEFSVDYGATGESLTRLIQSETAARALTPGEASRRTQLFRLDTTAVEAGLGTFNLAPDSPVAARVQTWLEAVEGGQAQRLAARDADLDWALLRRLADLGRANVLGEGALST